MLSFNFFFFNNFTVGLYFPDLKQTAGCTLNNSEEFGSTQVPCLCQKSFSDGPEFLFPPLCQWLTSGKEKIQLKAVKSNVLFIFLLTELFSGHLRNQKWEWKKRDAGKSEQAHIGISLAVSREETRIRTKMQVRNRINEAVHVSYVLVYPSGRRL